MSDFSLILLIHKNDVPPINLSIFREHVCQMPGVRPQGTLMPSPRASIKLRMPHPRD